MDGEEMEEEYAVLKHGNLDGFSDAFADIRERLKGKLGEPILLVERRADPASLEGFLLRLGILRDEKLLLRKEWTVSQLYSLAFHTGPVAWVPRWTAPQEKEGPLSLHDTGTVCLVQERYALRNKQTYDKQSPFILIGKKEIDDWIEGFFAEHKERRFDFLRIYHQLIEKADVDDPDGFGRTLERKKLLDRLIAVNELYDPGFGGPDEIDHPKMRKTVGEMALCIRRAAQLQYPHELVEKFKHYLAP